MLPPPEDATTTRQIQDQIRLFGKCYLTLYTTDQTGTNIHFLVNIRIQKKNIFKKLACLGDGSFIQTIRFFRGLLVCPPQDVGGSTLKEQFVNYLRLNLKGTVCKFILTIRFFRGLLVCPQLGVGGSTLKEQTHQN